jgi:hypothetical protein
MNILIDRYKKLKQIIIKTKIPKSHAISPNAEQYSRGIITRYFIQLRDTPGSPIFEVDDKVFVQFNNTPFYKGVKLNWRISGNLEDSYTIQGALIPSVMNSNQKAIKEAEKVLPELNLYLVNLKQFYKS